MKRPADTLLQKARKRQFPGLFSWPAPVRSPHPLCRRRTGRINRRACCNIGRRQGNREFSPMDSDN
ncbi:hypothetical protein D0C28_12935 [Rhizobium sp. AU243]|nr:hypothetical protein D0C28_12935 [Rhizobium sp. AU243]